MARLVFVLCVVLAVIATKSSFALIELPDFVKFCPMDDRIEECFRENLISVGPMFAHGYEPLNITSLNPMTLKKLVVSPKSRGLLISAEDFNIYNAHNYTITKSKVVHYPVAFTLSLDSPRYYVNGTYNIDGQLLFLQLKGRGHFEMWVDRLSGDFDLKTKIYKREDGVEMMAVRELSVKIFFDKCKIRLYDLFNGDQVLTDTVNEALNANMDVIAKDLTPLLEKRFAGVFTDIVNNFLKNFTRKQLFAMKED